MSKLTSWMDRKLYPGEAGGWDHRVFRELLEQRIGKDDDVLDIGAGRGGNPQMDLRPLARRVFGADVDPVVMETPFFARGEADRGW